MIRAMEIAHASVPCNPPQSTSAEPGRATPTRRAGCLWSTLRSTRCANGWSVADIKKGRSSAIDQRDSAEGEGLTPQSKRRCAMAGLELEAFFGVRTSRRISDRGGAARRGIAPLEGDAAAPGMLSSAGRELLRQRRARAGRLASLRKLSADNFLSTSAAGIREGGRISLH